MKDVIRVTPVNSVLYQITLRNRTKDISSHPYHKLYNSFKIHYSDFYPTIFINYVFIKQILWKTK